jgi:hypothetical protein
MTLEEFHDGSTFHFESLDHNNDGRLTEKEFMNMADGSDGHEGKEDDGKDEDKDKDKEEEKEEEDERTSNNHWNENLEMVGTYSRVGIVYSLGGELSYNTKKEGKEMKIRYDGL